MIADSTELLRFTTAGSVDDGKSTLIGRLLYDSKTIFEDQLSALARSSERRGATHLDLSLLTDGLVAEREQGITIDVAYRYFATPKRRFIVADTPGHAQYTRNMVTGASTAHLAIVLIDATKGVLRQTRLHALIASLLGIPHLVVAVNKMDLVQYAESKFSWIKSEFLSLAEQLTIPHLHFVPIAALTGDMVVERGTNLHWYSGPTLLELLETTPNVVQQHEAFRFPVQLVGRAQLDTPLGYRGYMGRIESGSVAVGDRVTVLPSGLTSTVKDIVTYDGRLDVAGARQPVTLLLDDNLDISRGDMIVHTDAQPRVTHTLNATICWMDRDPFVLGRRYLIKHTTRTVQGVFTELTHRIDVETLQAVNAGGTLALNDIAQAVLRLQQPLVVDAYLENRATGSFIVIDAVTHHTVAAGMVQ